MDQVMTVLVVGVPDGEQLDLLRSGIQRNPHFPVVSHATIPPSRSRTPASFCPTSLSCPCLPGSTASTPIRTSSVCSGRCSAEPGCLAANR